MLRSFVYVFADIVNIFVKGFYDGILRPDIYGGIFNYIAVSITASVNTKIWNEGLEISVQFPVLHYFSQHSVGRNKI